MKIRGRLGGVLLALAGLQLLVVEAIAASAWRSPSYSYATNYISDLGASGCPTVFSGRAICSPLASAMNVSFVADGVLVLLGAVLLVGLAESAWRWVFFVLAVLHAAGLMLVGFFPETSPTGLHTVGATLAIAGGDLAVIAAGIALRRHPLGIVVILIGVVGAAGAVLLETTTVVPPGVLERVAVYAIIAFEVVVGIAAVRRAGSTRGAPTR